MTAEPQAFTKQMARDIIERALDQRQERHYALAEALFLSRGTLARKLGPRYPDRFTADEIDRLAAFLELSGGERDTLLTGHGHVADLPSPATVSHTNGAIGPISAAAVPEIARGTNLPLPLTSFIGREWERTTVKRLLAVSRLVTLTGAGGIGKTRLALQTATEHAHVFPDGVWLVELAALTEAALVPAAVTAALGLRPTPSSSATDGLIKAITTRTLLLVLDNCEHLVGECARLAEALLQACPTLTILATSREPLRVPGEVVWPAPPLTLPTLGDGGWGIGVGSPLARPPTPIPYPLSPDATASEAVRLFSDRAAAVRPDFAVSDANAAAVAGVCRRLDGIPLAIELAAARVNVLSVEQIAARLGSAAGLLNRGSRTSVPRHQTLHGVIDWSHDLLTDDERALFRRLSVFAGGFTIAAAEAVVAGIGGEERARSEERGANGNEQPELRVGGAAAAPADSRLPTPDSLDLLAGLVDKSLVLMAEVDGAARYRMLETVRQYARDRLDAAGERATVGRAHLSWYMDFVADAATHLRGPDQKQWLDRIEREHDNIRAALAWAIDAGDAELGLRLGTATAGFWEIRHYLAEGCEWLERALALPGPATTTAVRAAGLRAAGILTFWQGNHAHAGARYEQSLALYRELDDTRGIASLLNNLGTVAARNNDSVTARARYEESLALFRGIGDVREIAQLLFNLGMQAEIGARYASAHTYFEESLAHFRQMSDRWAIGRVLTHFSYIIELQGDYASARTMAEEGLALGHELDNTSLIASGFAGLSNLLEHLGDAAGAAEYRREALRLARTMQDPRFLVLVLVYQAQALTRQGDVENARSSLEEGMAAARELGEPRLIGLGLYSHGLLALCAGVRAEAESYFRQSLAIRRQISEPVGIAASLEGLVVTAAAGGRPHDAALFLGAAEALRDTLGAPVPPIARPAIEQARVAMHDALGDDAATLALTEGRETPLDEILTRILEPAPLT
ncbi:MAG: tetratricopeptide repeat protein [Chloroflexi bacterium]|nr:tetratricopeptide repeat protein [Chloroflexota bacterium]